MTGHADLPDPFASILAKGRVDEDDVLAMRRAVWPDGRVSRRNANEKAPLLFLKEEPPRLHPGLREIVEQAA